MIYILIFIICAIYLIIQTFSEASESRRDIQNKYDTMITNREYIEHKYTDTEITHSVDEYVACGQHYDDICNMFKNEFEFVFGENWQEILYIPNGGYLKTNKNTSLYFHRHDDWVSSLILSRQGLLPSLITLTGFPLAGGKDRDIAIRFVQCIEANLHNNGASDINFFVDSYSHYLIIETTNPYNLKRLW